MYPSPDSSLELLTGQHREEFNTNNRLVRRTPPMETFAFHYLKSCRRDEAEICFYFECFGSSPDVVPKGRIICHPFGLGVLMDRNYNQRVVAVIQLLAWSWLYSSAISIPQFCDLNPANQHIRHGPIQQCMMHYAWPTKFFWTGRFRHSSEWSELSGSNSGYMQWGVQCQCSSREDGLFSWI
jgi:hypothetical protein